MLTEEKMLLEITIKNENTKYKVSVKIIKKMNDELIFCI